MPGPGHRLQARRARLAGGPGGRPRARTATPSTPRPGTWPRCRRAPWGSTTWSPSWPPSSDLPCGPSWWRPSGTSRSCGTCPIRCPPHGAVVRVEATGLCRSDWHGWLGHDPDIALPHVPGHEFAGVVAAVGAGVRGWRPGDRVTAPFVCACGRCPACLAGDQQVCERPDPARLHPLGLVRRATWRSTRADVNLVRLPDELDLGARRRSGCRFATAFRAVARQAGSRAGEWVAVHGCGGVGLSAVMIAVAAGARVVAVDVAAARAGPGRELRRRGRWSTRADRTWPRRASGTLTGGGAHLSLDALGSPPTWPPRSRACAAAAGTYRSGCCPPRTGARAADGPGDRAELELLGSHGMAAHAYPELLRLVAAGRLRPGDLVTSRIGLPAAGPALAAMGEFPPAHHGGRPVRRPCCPPTRPRSGRTGSPPGWVRAAWAGCSWPPGRTGLPSP